MKQTGIDSVQATQSLIAGSLSGATVRALLQPLDVLKIRWQLQLESISRSSSASTYRTLPQTVQHIFHEEGLRAFWKGHVPCQIVSVLYNSIQFSTVNVSQQMLAQYRLQPDSEFASYAICGALGGAAGATVSHPFDTARTRLIGQSERNRIYSGLGHCVRRMVREEGWRSFYKGYSANICMAAPQAGLYFAIYHQLKRSLSLGSGACGFVAGMAAKVCVYPWDLVKKRQQVRGFELARLTFGRVHSQPGSSAISYIIDICRNEGPMALFKGAQPALIKAGLVTACTFTFQELYSDWLAGILSTLIG